MYNRWKVCSMQKMCRHLFWLRVFLLCQVGPKTAMEGTQCLCTHLTSFGGDFVVAPNTIDWSEINLDNLFSNPVVFAVVLSIITLYFILLIPARRQDKKDLEKVSSWYCRWLGNPLGNRNKYYIQLVNNVFAAPRNLLICVNICTILRYVLSGNLTVNQKVINSSVKTFLFDE